MSPSWSEKCRQLYEYAHRFLITYSQIQLPTGQERTAIKNLFHTHNAQLISISNLLNETELLWSITPVWYESHFHILPKIVSTTFLQNVKKHLNPKASQHEATAFRWASRRSSSRYYDTHSDLHNLSRKTTKGPLYCTGQTVASAYLLVYTCWWWHCWGRCMELVWIRKI